MSATPAPQRRRLEHDERRRQILECALELFSERSYVAVSTAEIARRAGVTRGLINHYFGTKRDLYLEVVRWLVRVPSSPIPHGSGGVEEAIEEGVGRWLDLLEPNRGTWLAVVGTQGLGRDPEVAAILDESRERTCDRLIETLGPLGAEADEKLVRATIRSWGGLAETASVEWLQRGRLSREQVHTLLVSSFLALVREVVPGALAAGG